MDCDFIVTDWISETMIRKHGITIPREAFNKIIEEHERIVELEFSRLKSRMRANLRPKDKESNIERVFKVVCDEFQVSYDELVSKSRQREIVTPRHVARYLLKEGYAGVVLTLWQISIITTNDGKRDHAIVLNSVNAVNNLLDTDKAFREKVERCIDVINKTQDEKQTTSD